MNSVREKEVRTLCGESSRDLQRLPGRIERREKTRGGIDKEIRGRL